MNCFLLFLGIVLKSALSLLDLSDSSVKYCMKFLKQLVAENTNVNYGLRKEIGLGRVLKLLKTEEKFVLIIQTAVKIEKHWPVITQYLSNLLKFMKFSDEAVEFTRKISSLVPDDSLLVSQLKEFTKTATFREHDNDFPEDFRKIQPLPTVNELNTSSKLKNVWIDASRREEDGIFGLLEKQFRLYREDMVGPILADLHDAKKQLFSHPIPFGVDFSERKCSIKVAFTPYPELQKRLLDLKGKDVKLVKLCNFLKFDAPKVLATESLLLFTDEHKKVFFVGKIVKRNPEEMTNNWSLYGKLSVCVEFAKSAMKIVLQSLSKLDHPRSPVSQHAIQSNVSLFNYLPVLERLRGISLILLFPAFLAF
jgi:hypothetical protein